MNPHEEAQRQAFQNILLPRQGGIISMPEGIESGVGVIHIDKLVVFSSVSLVSE
jgi:hypothetical protein